MNLRGKFVLPVFALAVSLFPVTQAAAAPVAPSALSGCDAYRTGPYSSGGGVRFHGGHSYCASGGTSGEQRVKVWCAYVRDASRQFIAYGPWQVAGSWSEASCGTNWYADQAQYQTSS